MRSVGRGVRFCSAAILSWMIALCFLTSSSRIIAAQDGGSSAPTNSLSPVEIDQAWQRASAKYDGARNEILKRVDQVNGKGAYRPAGNRCSITKCLNGTKMRSSESLFTGGCIRFRLLAASGIPVKCILRIGRV